MFTMNTNFSFIPVLFFQLSMILGIGWSGNRGLGLLKFLIRKFRAIIEFFLLLIFYAGGLVLRVTNASIQGQYGSTTII